MADLQIPLPKNVPSFRQRTTLDGVEYILEMRWSMREGRWFLDVRDIDGNLLAGPMKAVVNFPILQTVRAGRSAAQFPPGELLFVDARESPADPGFDDLGQTVSLLYREAG